jgi:predicted outer membrane repeat protein
MLAGGASATVLNVPGEYATIQAAVDAALPGDTILLASGTFTGSGNLAVDFDGKSLVLTSQFGADSTRIDCQRSGLRALYLHSGEDSTTTISGITFRNGDAYTGMVHLQGVSPRFYNCVFEDYYLDGQGTAVLVDNASPSFVDCRFADNVVGCSACKTPEETDKLPIYVAGALKIRNGSDVTVSRCEFSNNLSDAEGLGGAVSVQQSTVTIDSTSFTNNIASDGGVGGPTPYGGAIAAYRSVLAVLRCQFVANSATSAGGAIYVDDSSSLTVLSSRFENNSVENFYRGGALFADSSVVTVDSTVFLRNQATHGGAVYLVRSAVALGHSLLAHNTARDMTFDEAARGGALFASASDLTLDHVTLSHNRADTSGFGEPGLGGGLYVATSSIGIVASVISFSLSGAGIFVADSSSTPALTCSNIYGNEGGDWIDLLLPQLGADGNFSANPYYCNAAGDEFTLYDISPCADSLSPCSTIIGAYPVACLNETPVITSPDSVIAFEGENFSYRTAFEDSFAPDTVISYDLLPSWLTVSADSVFGSPIAGQSDTSLVTRVSDGYLSDTLLIFIRVVATNDPPQLNQITPRQVAEGDSLTFTVQASDPDSTIPTLSADSLPYGAVFTDQLDGTGRFRWAPDFWQAGEYEVYFVAGDDSSASDTMITAITVENRNAAPVILPITDTSTFEGNLLLLSVIARDPDSTAPDLFADLLPPGATFTIDSLGFGAFEWLPGYDDQGAHEVVLIAVDDSLVADTLAFLITVLNINRPPILEAPDSVTASEGQPLAIVISAIDPDGVIPAIVVDSLPDGSSFADSGNGTAAVHWTPEYNQHGEYHLGVRALDDSLATDTLTIAVVVADVDIPPEIDSISALSAFEGDTSALRVTAIDRDGIPPSLRAENLPADAQFVDSGAGIGGLEWIIPYGDTGQHAITIVAEDEQSADTGLVVISVSARRPEIRRILIDGLDSNLHVVDETPLVEWMFFDTAGHPQVFVEVEFGEDADWAVAELWNPDSLQITDSLIVYAGEPLVDGNVYFLRLRANNGYSWSRWHEMPFRVNSLPLPPPLRFPRNGQIVETLSPTLFVLQAIDFENDPLYYDFEVSTDSLLNDVIASVAAVDGFPDSTGWSVTPPLGDDRPYWWRSRAFDGYEYGEWAEPDWFVVNGGPTAPGSFGCVAPPSSATPFNIIYEMLPTFDWHPSLDTDPDDTVSYSLLIARDSVSDVVARMDSIRDTSYTLTDSLRFGHRYWWFVEATDLSDLTTASTDTLQFWTWMLGDVTHDHAADLADLIFLINGLFLGGAQPDPLFTGDVNGDCQVDLSDLIYLVNLLFLGGPDLRVGCSAPEP